MLYMHVHVHAHLDLLQPRPGGVHRAARRLVHHRTRRALRLAVDKHVRAGGGVGVPRRVRQRRRRRPVRAVEPERRLDALLDASEVLQSTHTRQTQVAARLRVQRRPPVNSATAPASQGQPVNAHANPKTAAHAPRGTATACAILSC